MICSKRCPDRHYQLNLQCDDRRLPIASQSPIDLCRHIQDYSSQDLRDSSSHYHHPYSPLVRPQLDVFHRFRSVLVETAPLHTPLCNLEGREPYYLTSVMMIV